MKRLRNCYEGEEGGKVKEGKVGEVVGSRGDAVL